MKRNFFEELFSALKTQWVKSIAVRTACYAAVVMLLLLLVWCIWCCKWFGFAEQPVHPTPTPTSTPTPTTEPTPTPTSTPTTAPESTQLPEDWYIDPAGLIPQDVKIEVPNYDTSNMQKQYCITTINEKTMLQCWDSSGCSEQWEVPKDLLEANWIGYYGEGDIILLGYKSEKLEDVFRDTAMLYYENEFGYNMFFSDVLSLPFSNSNYFLIATPKGEAILYQWGNEYYNLHSFAEEYGENIHVMPDSNIGFIIGKNEAYEEYFSIDEIQWDKVPLNPPR